MTSSIGLSYNTLPVPLAIKPGHKVLSIGYGVGSMRQELTERVGLAGLLVIADISHNMSAQEMHATLDSISTSLDRIHCRLVLSQMPPKKARKLVMKMLNKLDTGGRLVLEEVTTHLSYEQPKKASLTTIKNFLESMRYKVTYWPPLPFFYTPESLPHPNIAQISLTKYY